MRALVSPNTSLVKIMDRSVFDIGVKSYSFFDRCGFLKWETVS